MGIADIIPGVSGGTIAFLVGIYEELIESIHSFDMVFVRRLLKGHVRKAFLHTQWKFLIVLMAGILVAIFSLSHLLKWLLVNQQVYLYAFFFGLILATVFIIASRVKKGDFAKMAIGLVSAVAMYKLVGMVPMQTPEAWWFLFLSGAIAICAMILPGISGAFILLLLGKYEFIITAVSERNFAVLIIVALGCGVGLLSFVRVLRWLLHRYYDLTLSLLAGLILGSLRKIWPWKEVISSIVTPSGKILPVQEINILPPADFYEVTTVIILFLLGVVISVLLARLDPSN